MKNVSFEALKLKTYLEHLERTTTIENATNLLSALESMKNENFQIIQDVFLSRLLILMDSFEGRNKNDFKTIALKCMNIILLGSRILKELPYKTILCIVLKQIFDVPNSYKKDLPEELKIAVFKCFEISSSHLDPDVVEKFMVNDNKILLGQCLFACKEAIATETYLKLRKGAIEAMMSLTQCHDKFDQNDIVLKEQISKILFIVLPQVATVLIKVCQEDCLRGPHLIEAAIKCLGRFLCLILQNYNKSCKSSIGNEEFLRLINSANANDEGMPNNQPKITKLNVEKIEKSKEWMTTTSQNLSKIIVNLKCIRGSEHSKIRYELAVLSFNLLYKCMPNTQLYMRFLLENLILFTDDSDEKIQSFSQKGLKELSNEIPNINQEISELFSIHLATMPRVILTGLESEQFAAMSLINSYIKIFICSDSQLNATFENPIILEKFINVMKSCCELNSASELINYETTTSNVLHDEYYKMKMPWKNFKNLKNEAVFGKFAAICKNIASSKFSQVVVNFVQDNVNSLEHLVFLNEILNCDKEKLLLSSDHLYSIMDEFLNDIYWNIPVKAVSQINKTSNGREEWFQDSTPGLYESAIEVRLRDVALDDSDNEDSSLNLKTIKYNILCTCTLLELIGNIAIQLGNKFQRYILRCLHHVLEKAGTSNFLIKSAGLYSLECISHAMGHSDISQLIDVNSDYLLFNINKLLKHNHKNEALLDMMSVVFKYSKTSVTAYVEDIVEMAANHIINEKLSNKSSYLKLFSLYVDSVKQWNEENESDVNFEIKSDWDEYLQQCYFELESWQKEEQIDTDVNNDKLPDNHTENQTENAEPEEKLPQHIQLIIKVLNSSLPFFASSNSKEVILVHEIFQSAFPIIHLYEGQFLPLVHQMWYPFTKQIQGKDYVVLQYSIRLLSLIGKLAKDFVYKRSIDNVIPIVNEFLKSSFSYTNKNENLTYTQQFKLQREILSDYGQLTIDLGIDEKQLDEIIDILILYNIKHMNGQLKSASKKSLDVISTLEPLLIKFKYDYQ